MIEIEQKFSILLHVIFQHPDKTYIGTVIQALYKTYNNAITLYKLLI